MFFWDEDRFLHIRMTSTSEYLALAARYEEALYRARSTGYDNTCREIDGSCDLDTIAPRKRWDFGTDDIIRWTRSNTQCTFGEWMAGS